MLFSTQKPAHLLAGRNSNDYTSYRIVYAIVVQSQLRTHLLRPKFWSIKDFAIPLYCIGSIFGHTCISSKLSNNLWLYFSMPDKRIVNNTMNTKTCLSFVLGDYHSDVIPPFTNFPAHEFNICVIPAQRMNPLLSPNYRFEDKWMVNARASAPSSRRFLWACQEFFCSEMADNAGVVLQSAWREHSKRRKHKDRAIEDTVKMAILWEWWSWKYGRGRWHWSAGWRSWTEANWIIYIDANQSVKRYEAYLTSQEQGWYGTEEFKDCKRWKIFDYFWLLWVLIYLRKSCWPLRKTHADASLKCAWCLLTVKAMILLFYKLWFL